MNKWSYAIDRRTVDGEIERSIIPVATAVKSGFVTKLRPSHRAERRSALQMISARYDDWSEWSVQQSVVSAQHPTSYIRLKAEHNKRQVLLRNRNQFLAYIAKFENSTLQMILDTSNEDFSHVTGNNPEPLLRETLTYAHLMDGTYRPDKAIAAFNDVRQSHPKFALEDLSELSGNDRVEAESIIRVSHGLRTIRLKDHFAAKASRQQGTPFRIKGPDKIIGVIIDTPFMSRELATVVVDFPDRTESIVDYLVSHPFRDDAADAEHLRDHLLNPAPALSIGIL